ncbi:hypothetical protein [Mesorhizobium sp. BR1-1-16]|nr:hypothetical protein [Mesorhizobium sp. BR1-1-16]
MIGGTSWFSPMGTGSGASLYGADLIAPAYVLAMASLGYCASEF